MFISRGVQNGCICNMLLFRQVGRLRSITLLIFYGFWSSPDRQKGTHMSLPWKLHRWAKNILALGRRPMKKFNDRWERGLCSMPKNAFLIFQATHFLAIFNVKSPSLICHFCIRLKIVISSDSTHSWQKPIAQFF